MATFPEVELPPEVKLLHEHNDEVSLFNVLPKSETDGTAFDYYLKFPFFDEEIYYVLQCTTKEDSDPARVVSICKDIVDSRNKELLRNFGKPNDTLILDDYEFPHGSGISELSICDTEAERDAVE